MSKDSKVQKLENIPNDGLLRLAQVLTFIPVSRSHWWAGVKTGKYPKPRKLSKRITVWTAAQIRDVINGGV
jgi:predicted DNA-binding transcriptional regulator AlpA